jgi:predicted RNA-binding protein YlqC (UPF0109 family)
MRYFLEFVLRRLVGHPDDIDLRQIENPSGVTFHVSVHPDDIGKVIGKNGRTITAIRGLLNAAASRTGETRVTVQLYENTIS